MPLRGRLARRLRVQERGAAAMVLALVICFIVVPLAGLAVDIGVQHASRSDAQAIADTVALDVVRDLPSATQSQLNEDAVSSADRDAGGIGSPQATQVWEGYVGASSTFVSDQARGCDGTPYDSYFQQVPSGKTANAVVVVVRATTQHAFMPGSGSVCRSALATTIRNACFSVDSYAAQIASGNSAVLAPLLKALGGGNVDVGVLSSSGIVTTQLDLVSFMQLLGAQLGVGSPDQLLTTNVTLSQFLGVMATALTQSGTASAAVSALQQQIAAKVGPLANQPIQLGQLISLAQGSASALGASVNALDLAMAAVEVANGQHAAGLTLSTPSSISSLSASLSVIQTPPPIACGQEGASATSAQIKLALSASIFTPASLVGGLLTDVGGLLSNLLGFLTGSHTPGLTIGNITLSAAVAQATGTLTAIQCTGPTATGLTLSESSALAPITLSVPLSITDTYVGPLGIGGYTHTANLTLQISTASTSAGTTSATLPLPADYGKPVAGPSGNLSVNNLTVSVLGTSDLTGVLGMSTSQAASLVNDLQTWVVGPLESTVLTPLLSTVTSTLSSLLGVTLAGSTYTAMPTAQCGAPSLGN